MEGLDSSVTSGPPRPPALLPIQLPANVLDKAGADGLGTWVPVTDVGDKDGVTNCSPALIVADIWRVNKCMEDLCISLSRPHPPSLHCSALHVNKWLLGTTEVPHHGLQESSTIWLAHPPDGYPGLVGRSQGLMMFS